MVFKPVSSPHRHGALSTARVMQWVLLALIPGIAVLSWQFGWGTLINIAIATVTALLCEAAALSLRGRRVGFYLRDYSAAVTALLLAVALPPLAPWWLVVIATASAVLIAKQVYGGLGYNPFNPAMVGYVVVLISFPLQISSWPTPLGLLSDASQPSLGPSLAAVATGTGIDGWSGATPLDLFKHGVNGQLVSDFVAAQPLFSQALLAGLGWEWVNLAFLAGGVLLLAKGIFTWHAPVAMLGSLALMALLFWDGGSSHSGGSLLLHLFSGATMLGAFFIITDPVSSAVSTRGRLIYGALIGVLTYLIRVWGNYPDGVAFAVLLGNFAAPFIDNYTLPRSYGHSRARRATEQSK